MSATSLHIETAGGHLIAAQWFGPKESHTTVIISSATGVKQSYYKKFAAYIAGHGIAVVTFDYYGIGDSFDLPIRRLQNNAHDWGRIDLESVICYARQANPNAAIVLLGHSIGGQLIGLTPAARHAKKVILVAAQSGYWRYWRGKSRVSMWLNWYVTFPLLLNLFGYLPSKKFSAMENLPKNVASQWRSWCVSPNYYLDHLPASDLYFQHIDAALLSISIQDDHYAPRKAVDWLTGQYENSKVSRRHIKPTEYEVSKIGHFGVFREKFKETLWQYLLNEIFMKE